MQETPPARRAGLADVLMVLLCAITSFWLLASPLVPYVFDDSVAGLTQFLIANLVLTVVLATIGIKLNHLASRNERVSFGRGRRR
jgi:hypothetical protein